MNKQELLSELRRRVQNGEVSSEEVLTVLDDSSGRERGFFERFSEVFYYIGAAIILIGMLVLLGQFWGDLSPAVQILIGLGAPVVCYVSGFLFLKFGGEAERIALALFILSGPLFPVGLLVALHHSPIDPSTSAGQLMVSIPLTVLFLASFWWVKKSEVFVVFSILFGTWVYLGLLSWLFQTTGIRMEETVWQYLLLFLGLIYLSLGYAFEGSIFRRVVSGLYFFGTGVTLLTTLWLSGFYPDQNLFWEMLYPFLILSALALSVYVQRKAIFILTALFLLAYILKLTSAYFADTLGWPLALVIVGGLVIALGYGMIRFYSHYLTGRSGR